MLGWLGASFGLRVYVHYINNYGSLGTVIIQLTWFYLSGLMLLLGGEINSEIETEVMENKLAAMGALKREIVGTSSRCTLNSLLVEPHPHTCKNKSQACIPASHRHGVE